MLTTKIKNNERTRHYSRLCVDGYDLNILMILYLDKCSRRLLTDLVKVFELKCANILRKVGKGLDQLFTL